MADVGVLVRPWLDVIDELLNLSPTISDPQEVGPGNPESAERRGLVSAGATPAGAAVPLPGRGWPRAYEPGGQPAAQCLSAR